MTGTLNDRPIALVTGASRGLGRGLALALAPSHHIVAVARTTGALEALDDEIRAAGGTATLAPMDVTVTEAMATLCRGIHDRWGRVDLWCHTAIHASPLSPAFSLDARDLGRAIATNVTAVGTLIPFVAPLLGEEGQAVFFEDPRAGQKFFGAYGATKAAQIAMARSWQAESVRTGPKVHVIEPRPMATTTRARFFPGEDKSVLADPVEEGRRIVAELGL